MSYDDTTALKVKNLSKRPLKAQHANQKYVIKPGESRFLPAPAAFHWCGNPDARDVGDPDTSRGTQKRREERERLSVLYGVYSFPWAVDAPYVAEDPIDARGSVKYDKRRDGQYWHPNLPEIEVTTFDGTVLPTVLADPFGENLAENLEKATDRAERNVLESNVAELQRKLAELQLELARTRVDVEPVETGSVQVVEEPVMKPEPRRRGAGA